MKHIYILLLSCFLFTSCAVVMHSKFTNVDSLLSVNRGESLSKVIEKIGFYPEDVYVQQTTGYKIVLYKYKIKQRQIAPESVNFVGSEKAGTEKYLGKLHKVYFIFDTSDKLISYVTDSGRGDANSVLSDDERILNFKNHMSNPTQESPASPSTPSKKKKKKKVTDILNPLL